MTTLLLADPSSIDDVSRAAPVLASVAQVAPADAAQRLRRQWGVLAEHLSPPEAERWRDAFAAAKIPVVLRGDGPLPALPAPEPAGALAFGAAGSLSLTLRQGGSVAPAGPELRLLAALWCTIDHSRTVTVETGPSAAQRAVQLGIMATTGLPIQVGPKKQKVEKVEHRSETLAWLDLVSGPRRFRIDGAQFDYSVLGPKKGYSMAANFRTLLRELQGLAPQAVTNHGARMLMAGKAPAELGYSSPEDFERELRWLAAIEGIR